MLIAIDARFFFNEAATEYDTYLKELFVNLSEHHPTHQFVFLTDRSHKQSLMIPKNASFAVIAPKNTSRIASKIWVDFGVSSYLKNNKVHVFVSAESVVKTIKAPQVFFASAGHKLSEASFFRGRLLRYHLKKNITRATVIATIYNCSCTSITGNI